MAACLRDWKPGKRLAARARHAAEKMMHVLPPFRPSPHDIANGEEFPNYFAECDLCGKFVILVFDFDNRNADGDHETTFYYFGSAVDGEPCPRKKG